MNVVGPFVFVSFVCPQCWENGIVLCRKIAEQYESYYDYRNLSKMRVRNLDARPSGKGILSSFTFQYRSVKLTL